MLYRGAWTTDRAPPKRQEQERKNEKVVPIGAYTQADIPAPVRIRNGIAEDGVAFPQEELPDEESGNDFFAAQSRCAVAEDGGRASCRSGRCPAGLG